MNRERSTFPIAALLVFGAALVLAGCHDLVNPVDPNSSRYGGQPTLADPPGPGAILPPIERWETIAQHAPEQFLGLEIPEDGSLIDPRQPASPQEFFVVITFEEPVYVEDFEDALVFVRVNDGSNVTTGIVSPEINPVYRQAVIRTSPPEPPFFSAGTGGATVRIRVVDATGVVMGERLFGLLPGDFNGDGFVTTPDDWNTGGANFDGELADEGIPATVRADMDADGVVATGSDDLIVLNQEVALAELPAPPPPF